nr:hypothetical protein [uncultured Rhodoferax sp.]
MSGYRYEDSKAVYDGETGEYIGQLNLNGKVDVVPTFKRGLTGGISLLANGIGIPITKGLFVKLDKSSPAFTKTSANTAAIKAGTYVDVAGALYVFAINTPITMPALMDGTDYAIYACTDGTLCADASFSAPIGYTTANSRQIGGFHYAPGGGAVAIAKAAIAGGTEIGAQTVTANKWALYALAIDVAGSITVTPAVGNVAGYATEALAIAALPARPASTAAIGYVTVLTASGLAWIAGTDALAGGTGGNPASQTKYYPQTSAAIGLTLAIGTTPTAISSTAFTYYLGGDSTPQINTYSFWDIKFRPNCSDPRGMALVANTFWADVYLTGVDHYTNGTSKYNSTIADGSSPPKVPSALGGDGATAYTSLTWWEACEVAISAGKRLPTYSEFSALAFGATEAASVGIDPVSTIWQPTTVSKWGCNQVAGVMWQWGYEFGGGAASSAYIANTNGRGSTYQMEDAVVFGGPWTLAANPGSRASSWGNSATNSNLLIGQRCVCNHIVLP